MQYMDPKLDWARWFAVALPVSFLSVFLVWLLILWSYNPSRTPDGEGVLEIKAIRPTRESFTAKQYWVSFVCVVTIALWCVEHKIEAYVGDMGVIALIPIVAFFASGVLRKVSQEKAVGTAIFSGLLTTPFVRMTLSILHGPLCSWPWAVSLWARASIRAACLMYLMLSFGTLLMVYLFTLLSSFYLPSFW
jgi:di/tricarboxylate transporter